MEIMELINKSSIGEITAVMGEPNLVNGRVLPNYNNRDKTVSEQLLGISSKEKVLKALTLFAIDESILNKSYKELSISLLNKLALIEALISNEEVLIFDNINKGQTYRECQNIKNILRKLASHNKKVILISNDIEFLVNLVKKVFVVKDDKVVKEYDSIDWFDEELYKYVSKPLIIEFIESVKKRNIKIDKCVETKELLKAIYRSVDK